MHHRYSRSLNFRKFISSLLGMFLMAGFLLPAVASASGPNTGDGRPQSHVPTRTHDVTFDAAGVQVQQTLSFEAPDWFYTSWTENGKGWNITGGAWGDIRGYGPHSGSYHLIFDASGAEKLVSTDVDIDVQGFWYEGDPFCDKLVARGYDAGMHLMYKSDSLPNTFGYAYVSVDWPGIRYISFSGNSSTTFPDPSGAYFIDDISYNIHPAHPVEVGVPLQAKWNLFSLPVSPPGKLAGEVFPGFSGNLYRYTPGGYATTDTLEEGLGDWMRSDSADVRQVDGEKLFFLSIPVSEGWNLVGSISEPVAVTSILGTPEGLTTSQFYSYGAGYTQADTLVPGKAYWVKANMAGSIILGPVSPTNPPGQALRIVPISEEPPSPPDQNSGDGQTSIPTEYRLEQNYPNPFNPATTISYELPSASHVSLTVFNLLGQEVAVLVDETQEAGYKTVSFNAGYLPSGVYTYRITAGTFTDTKRMLLLK